MVFTKIQFFILLFTILIGPFLIYKTLWLAGSGKTTGTVYFLGHTLELNGSISSHFVVLYKVEKATLTLNAGSDLPFKIGGPIPVRYQKDNPSDARVDLPDRIWGDTLVYTLAQLLILLILFLTPDRFDPLLPGKCKIAIGRRPLVKVIKC